MPRVSSASGISCPSPIRESGNQTIKRGQDSLWRGWGWLNSVDSPPQTRRREECDLRCLEPWQWTIGHFPQGRRLRSVREYSCRRACPLSMPHSFVSVDGESLALRAPTDRRWRNEHFLALGHPDAYEAVSCPLPHCGRGTCLPRPIQKFPSPR